jgi:hypothetical protein
MRMTSPLVNFFKRLPLGKVKHQDNTNIIPEICPRDGVEELLTGGVSYLELHVLPVDLDDVRIRFDHDRGLGIGGKCVFGELVESSRLANTARTDDDDELERANCNF